MLSYRYPFKKKLKEIHQTINMDSTERTINKRIFANDVSGLEQDSENEIQSENDISENEYSHNESSYLHEGSSINNGQTTSESDNDNDSDADSFSSDSTYLGPENYGFNSRRRSFAMFRGLVNDDDTVSEHSYDEDEDYLLDASGNRIAIGAIYHDNYKGTVRIYHWNGSSWLQLENDIDGEATSDRSGTSVAMSSDGTTIHCTTESRPTISSKTKRIRSKSDGYSKKS